MDKERVVKILSDVEKYFKDLEDREIKTVDDLRDVEKYYATSMILFSLLNRIIDLGQEIVLSKKLGMPSTYKEIFEILFERNFITKEMLNELKKLVDVRNILSHEYYRVDISFIFKAAKRVKVIKEFVKIMKKEIK
ncbi:MAG: DUF86 domain-containing protein [Candidatus Aenigmarchaeota archaeon]|nr:DUF86 domain-containing protein [Candidatus Aenigmarchaeota archaeon]